MILSNYADLIEPHQFKLIRFERNFETKRTEWLGMDFVGE
jgi:hypothetical protein